MPPVFTATPASGLVSPLAVGTDVATIKVLPTTWQGGVQLLGNDASNFMVVGTGPIWTVQAARVLPTDRFDIQAAAAPAPAAIKIQITVSAPTTPPIDPPPVSGWPSAKNTGVPAGMVLKPSGDITVTKAGTVLDGLNISGSVTINANDVTLKNSKVTTSAFNAILIKQGVTGTVIDRCEVNGLGKTSGNNGINGTGTFTFNNVYGFENDINIAGKGPTLIENNYLHGLKAPGSPHYDTIQIDGGVSDITIRHNTIINDYGQTSAVMIDNYWGPIGNIVVDDNVMVGGGYTIYVDGQFNGGAITGVSITNNHMGKGGYGITDFNKTSPVYTGNVDDGASIAAGL